LTSIIYGDRAADYIDCVVGEVPLRIVLSNYHEYLTTRDALTILKLPNVLERQIDFLTRLAPKNILEFGVFEGGSAIMWPAILGARYCGIDTRPGNPEIRYWIERFNLQDKVSLNFGVSQSDAEKVPEIVQQFFGGEGVDLVIDDASHMYGPSRRSFEIVFPLLKPGAVYLIEDWNWAHNPADLLQKEKFWREHNALTNLVFDLVMLIGTSSDLIDRVEVSNDYALIYKSAHCTRTGPISFDTEIAKQDRVFTPI